MEKITFVCCYNNKELFEELKKSIESQTEKTELIGINNISRKYSSCAKAFNSVVNQIVTEYVIFLHQDILFTQSNTSFELLKYLKQLNENDLLGVAGITFDSEIVSNINTGENGTESVVSSLFEGLVVAQSLDECLFGGRTSFFKNNPFDEFICNGWHLYAVERCLYSQVLGGKSYICDVSLIHKSHGKLDNSFFKCYRRLCKAYINDFKTIRTTCIQSDTDIKSVNKKVTEYKFIIFKSKIAESLKNPMRRIIKKV